MEEWLASYTAYQTILLYIAIPTTIVFFIQLVMQFFGGDADAGEAADSVDTVDDLPDDLPDDIPDDIPDGIPDDDIDFSVDDMEDMDAGEEVAAVAELKLLSLKSIMAFLMVFGWSGLMFNAEIGLPVFLSSIFATACGFGIMYVIAWILYKGKSMEYSGTIGNKQFVGKTGEVVITIPPKKTGKGEIKIQAIPGGEYYYPSVITDEAEEIPRFTRAFVYAALKDGTLLVKSK